MERHYVSPEYQQQLDDLSESLRADRQAKLANYIIIAPDTPDIQLPETD